MYIAVIRETSKTGKKIGEVGYRVCIAGHEGGPYWARTAKYRTPERCLSVAEDLCHSKLHWEPMPEPGIYSASYPPEWPAGAPEIPPICLGVGTHYPHPHGTLAQCPDCADELPVPGPESAQDQSGAPVPSSDIQEPSQEPSGSKGDPNAG